MAGSNDATVLVVDDNPIVRHAIGRMLRVHWTTLEATDVGDAIELMRAIHVDIVVTDFWMTGGDGFAVLQESKRLDPSRPVVCVSGVAYSVDMRAFDAVFEKPVDATALIAMLETMLAKRTHRGG